MPLPSSPTAAFTIAPSPTSPAWPAADPSSLPDEDLVIYSEGNKLRSLPHRSAFDRPEINRIHNREQQHAEMLMYVRTNEPVPSPDGRYVVLRVQGPEPPSPTPSIWLFDMASGQTQKVAVKGRESADMGSVTWSPDGCCLAFVAAETLYVYDVQAEAEPVAIFTQPGLHRLFAGWSPTGDWIAVASDANPQDTVSSDRAYIYWLISPDGAMVRNLGQYPVAGYGAAPYNLDWSPDGQIIVTPSQCFISTYEGLATCGDRDTFNLNDPTQWLPRAWVRSFLSQQFVVGERPSFYTWRLSPGGGQIAYSLYDHPNQRSELHVFDRFTNSHRQLWTVSGYVVNKIRWTNGEEFLVVRLGDPERDIEGGPVILLFDASAASPPQDLAKGENLYLIDVIPHYPAAEAASPPIAASPEPAPTPAPMQAGPVVDIPGSTYGVMEFSPLDSPACCPTVSPDGERLAFTTYRTMTQKIYVQNIDGSGLKEISSLRTQHGDGPCPDPAWSPDGQQLTFVNYDYGLYVVNADGTNLTRLEPAGLDPVWSPDGQQIAFVSDRDGNREIYVMNSDGSDQRRLTDHEAQDWGPVWSPDGRHVVFTSDRDGQNGIYVINSDGTGERWLMASDTPSRWRMDGTRVSFAEISR